MLKGSQDNLAAYKKLAEFNAITLEKSNQVCMDYSYEKMIDELRAVDWHDNYGGGNHDIMFTLFSISCKHVIVNSVNAINDNMFTLFTITCLRFLRQHVYAN